VGLADVRIKKIPVLKTGIAYINGGPLVRRDGSGDITLLAKCLIALIEEYAQRRKLLLRINPLPMYNDENQILQKAFIECGFQLSKNIIPYRTILIDIRPSLEMIRMQFNQKWRNCLNNAEKQDISVSGGTSSDLFEKFSQLYKQLRSRKKFDVDQDDRFFMDVQSRLDLHEKLYISIAQIDGIPVAGHVSSILGDTCVYLLGASSEQALKTKATYLLQWHTIKIAKEKNCKWYDLGGIDPQKNPGVYRFKQGMGGMEIAVAGPYEYYPGRLLKSVVLYGEKLHRWVRSIGK
jgi:lipid II:glycine glycyltransferase (peptidoglycan interpeptide bridge formation enzyme)